MRRPSLAASAALLSLSISVSLLPAGVVSAGTASPGASRSGNALTTLRESVEKVRVSGRLLRGSADDTVPGELIVTFDADATRSDRRDTASQIAPGDVETLAPGLALVDLGPGASDADELRAIDALEASPAVESVEPNLVRPPHLIPNDPRFDELWGLRNTGQNHPITDPPPANAAGSPDADIDADDAWDTQTGSNGTVLAVIDNGVDLGHPDLDGSLWINVAEAGGTTGVDDDANGYVDDVNGYDFKGDDGNPSPGSGSAAGHGTHVAGTIGAEMDNNVGVAGVCPDCRIMVLKFGYDVATELEAIQYAIDNGASVINASYGGPIWSASERTRIQQAGAAGILFVASAGNALGNNDSFMPTRRGIASPSFPATYTLSNIMSVAASNHRDAYAYFTGCAQDFPKWRCQFSNYGQESVDVAAPGVDVLSTWPTADGSYETINGTSMASPHVVGVAGLVMSEHPGYSPEDVKNAIMNGSDRPSSLDRLYVRGGTLTGPMTRTTGRINADAALTASTTDATPATDGQIEGAVHISRTKRGRVGWPGDVNDVFRKSLKRHKKYRATLVFGKHQDIDLWLLEPGTLEILQLQNGCFRRHGSCPVASFRGVTTDNPEVVTFRARGSGAHFFQVASFISRDRYKLTIKRAR